ncbi:hypothetical protein MMAG44476_32419 [Mycolicibacterium mageritense DSM 44476 = CIP 104973]|uniref:Uncharacterized protein n=2 Tax=Mycolicibacterium mageritense TaxID=53462 RepID=A0ABN5YEG3_MYCME|nr:hypothetical protein [Mycolicibacterium mageritense]MCC9181401.1 hypothetical protein [Mycolicibacterium mageritense]BBX36519.1 hypothetical protein MMAGJ_58010 [Mycolicibacterium mageritense]CDO24624.1 hypothetical protein BN978_05120 [Mycolicibacterium mageritense DSM 44476 = CIP 104973]
MQRQAGNQAVVNWVVGRRQAVQRLRAVQREEPDDETLKLEAAELATVPSGSGGTVRLSDPLHDAGHPDEKPNIAPLQIAATAVRNKNDGQRKGFDSQPEAVAFAVARAGGCGAGVVKRGRFYFVVTFVPNPDFLRQKVYAYTSAQGILTAVGNDGFVFDPAVTRYQPDTGLLKAEDLVRLHNDPAKSMPGTASPAELAAMAGVPPPGVKEGDAAAAGQGAVEIAPDQQEAFIRQYLVARGMAMLNANETATLKLVEDFKPTNAGDANTASSGVSANAKKMIDNAREVAADLAKVQDQEIALEKLMSDRDWAQSISRTSQTKWTAEGVTKTLREWRTDLEGRQKDIAARKNDIFAKNAVVAQLVSKREPDTGLGTDIKRALDSNVAWAIPGVKLGWEAYKAISPDNTANAGLLRTGTDEQVRAEMQKKLDAVVKAIREVKARTLAGDLKFLVSMPRLYDNVKADFARIKARNTMLAHELETIRVQTGSQVDVKEVIDVAGTALQLIGFFFPPAEFLGSVMTFGVAAARLGEALDQKTVAEAAATPDQAMLDPDKAQKKLSEATAALAIESVNLGMSMGGAAKAIEEGKVPAELKTASATASGVSDLMAMTSIEREAQVAASIGKVGEAMTVREAGGYATIHAALPSNSPSLKKINTWQNGVVAEMTAAVGEHQLAKAAGVDVGAAGLKPTGPLPAPRAATAPASLPPLPELDAKDVELARATLARSVGAKPDEAAKLTGITIEDPAALKRYMEVSPPPALAPDEMRRALAHHGALPAGMEGMQHLEPAAMKDYLNKMKAGETTWGTGAAGKLPTDPQAVKLVDQRCAQLASTVNGAIGPSGVPAVGVGFSSQLGAGAGGHFNMKTWRIEFSWETLAQDMTPSHAEFLKYANFHEGTHADQWWHVARMMATDNVPTATIASKLGMDPKIASLAVQEAKIRPLPVMSAEAAPYREIYTSISHSKVVDREGVLDRFHAAAARKQAAEAALTTAENELRAAESAWQAQKSQPPSTARKDAYLELDARQLDWNAAKTNLSKADQDYQVKLAAYLDLPEERQAQAAERALQKAGRSTP